LPGFVGGNSTRRCAGGLERGPPVCVRQAQHGTLSRGGGMGRCEN
jgi:hypothetical protein